MTQNDTIQPTNSNSIFTQPLAVSPQASKKANYLEDKNKRKAQLILGLSFLALIAYSIFFFYGNVSAYLKAPGEIETINKELENYEDNVIPELEVTKNSHKAAYDEEFQTTIEALDIVFPKDEDKLGIVQLLESFASEVDLISPPFEFTSMTIGKPVVAEGYQSIPISTTIHSSQAGFDKFLALVEKSGAIYEDSDSDEKVLLDKMVRLMSISNISIKYRGVDPKTGRDDGVDFTVKLNIYSRV